MFDAVAVPGFAPLGISGESVDRPAPGKPGEKAIAAAAGQRRRRELTRFAGALLYDPQLPAERQHATVWCHRASTRPDGGEIYRRDDGGGARFTGLATCGMVWVCPTCAAKIAEERRAELQAGMVRHVRDEGGAVYLATFTFPHDRHDDLADLDRRQREATKAFKAGKTYRRILGPDGSAGRIGSVKALEHTHGANGWHPHVHELWFCRRRGLNEGDADEAGRLSSQEIRDLTAAWVNALRKHGLCASDDEGWAYRYALDVRGGDKAADYVAKFGHDERWGASREMTAGVSKIGEVERHGQAHRTPFQLLADAMAGDLEATALFLIFVDVLRGRRQLTWSPGLKKRLGVDDRDDEEIAADETAKPTEYVAARWTREQLAILVSRRALGEAAQYVALYCSDRVTAQRDWDTFCELVRLRPREGSTAIKARELATSKELYGRGTAMENEAPRLHPRDFREDF